MKQGLFYTHMTKELERRQNIQVWATSPGNKPFNINGDVEMRLQRGILGALSSIQVNYKSFTKLAGSD